MPKQIFVFLFKKIVNLIPTLLGITLLAFFFIRLLPGDPVLVLTGEKNLPPDKYNELLANFGLDRPWWDQYWIYLKTLISGSFGTSISSRQGVGTEFLALFPATLELAIFAMLFAVLFGLPMGVLSAVYKNKWLDKLFTTLSLVGYSMPIFWLGLIMILIFSSQLGWFPVSGRISFEYFIPPVTGFLLIDSLLADQSGAFLSVVSHLFLPTIVLGTIPLAIITRQTRSVMLEVLGEDYIRTAKAKGVPAWRILFVHALRNAMIPIITVMGLQIGTLLTGAILTETIFSWPGIGKWMVDSIYRRDYPAVQGGLLIISLIVMTVNLLVDMFYYLANPRMRAQ